MCAIPEGTEMLITVLINPNLLLWRSKYPNLLTTHTIITGTHQQRVSAIGAHWIGVCVLLRPYPGHPVYRHVVPSVRNPVAHLGLYGPQLLLQQEDGGSLTGCSYRQGRNGYSFFLKKSTYN